MQTPGKRYLDSGLCGRARGRSDRRATLIEVPYRADGAAYFAAVADAPWAGFLDSGPPQARTGRWDIIVADPRATLVTWGTKTELWDGGTVRTSAEDPFKLVRQVLGPLRPSPDRVPFAGGLLGWFGYDLGRRIERLPTVASPGEDLPDMALGHYAWALVVDHQERRAWLTGASGSDVAERFRRPPVVAAGDTGFRVHGVPTVNLDEAAYRRAFNRIRDYIRAGDCYQVNLARRYTVPATGNPWRAYLRLRQLNPAPFSAFLRTPFGAVLSSSPERFLQLRHGWVETRPIKGTRPRSEDPVADAALALELAASPKDRSENVMIVDLLRNDLGRVCRPGTIQVPTLFALEQYASVYHLVSTITGQLAPGEDAASLLRACFPGGSITGAPKVRAMEIIEELEPDRRGVYCGAIGYLGGDGAMDVNIAIRTLVHSHDILRYWAGGGIVHDSRADAELAEIEHKAAGMRAVVHELKVLGAGRR